MVKLVDEGCIRWARLQPRTSAIKILTSIPMVLPTALIALVYLVTTIFSFSPQTSFWGSYQHLQRPYIMLYYLVLFFAILSNLRRREQVECLITTTILVNIPFSLHEFLQRYKLDPLPWCGNVTVRIA